MSSSELSQQSESEVENKSRLFSHTTDIQQSCRQSATIEWLIAAPGAV